MYKKLSDTMIQRDEDGAFIPVNPSNADYQAFKQWEGEGGIAEQAPEPEPEIKPLSTSAYLASVLIAKGILKPSDLDATYLISINEKLETAGLSAISPAEKL